MEEKKMYKEELPSTSGTASSAKQEQWSKLIEVNFCCSWVNTITTHKKGHDTTETTTIISHKCVSKETCFVYRQKKSYKPFSFFLPLLHDWVNKIWISGSMRLLQTACGWVLVTLWALWCCLLGMHWEAVLVFDIHFEQSQKLNPRAVCNRPDIKAKPEHMFYIWLLPHAYQRSSPLQK